MHESSPSCEVKGTPMSSYCQIKPSSFTGLTLATGLHMVHMVTRDPWVSKHVWGEEQKEAPLLDSPPVTALVDCCRRQERQWRRRGLLPANSRQAGMDGGDTTSCTHTDERGRMAALAAH